MPPQERDRPDSLMSKMNNSIAPFKGLLDPEAPGSETDATPGVESEIVKDPDELADLVSGETIGDDVIPSLSSLLQYIMCMFINFILHMLGINFVLGIFGLALKPLDDLRSVELDIEKSKDKKRKLQEMQMTKEESSLIGDGKRTKLDDKEGEEEFSSESEPEPALHSSLDKELSDSEESRATAEFEKRLWNMEPNLNFGSGVDWSDYHFQSKEKSTEPSALNKNLENTLGEKKEVLKVITPTDSFNDVLNMSGDISDTATGDEINDVAFGDSGFQLKIATEHESVREGRVDEDILEVQMDVEDEVECNLNNAESPPVIVQNGEKCQKVLVKHTEELIHSKSFQGNDLDMFTTPEEVIQNVVEEGDFQTYDEDGNFGQSSFLEDTDIIISEIVDEEDTRYLQCKEDMNSENRQIQLHQKLSRSQGQNSDSFIDNIDIQTSSMDINEGDDLSNNVSVSNGDGEGKNIEESSVLAIDIVGSQETEAEIEDEKTKSNNVPGGQSYTPIGRSEYADNERLCEGEKCDTEDRNSHVLYDEKNVNFNERSSDNQCQEGSLKNDIHTQRDIIEIACVSNMAYSETAIAENFVKISTEVPGELNHSTGESDDRLLSVKKCQDGQNDNFSTHDNQNIEEMRDEILYNNDSIIKSNITNDTLQKVENASVVPIEKSGRTEAKCEEVQSKDVVRRASEGSKGRRGQKSSGKKKKKRNLL